MSSQRRSEQVPATSSLIWIISACSILLGSHLTVVESHVESPHPLPEVILRTVVQVLEDFHLTPSGRQPSTDGNNSRYTTAAMLLPYMAPRTRQHTTLLIPTDDALMQFAPQAQGMSPSQMQSLAQFHMVRANLTFKDMVKLPVGTLLPTLLGVNYRLHVSSSLPTDYVISDARVVDPDICPDSLVHFLTCHGIDSVLAVSDVSDGNTGRPPISNSPPPPSPPANASPSPVSSTSVNKRPPLRHDNDVSPAPAPAPSASISSSSSTAPAPVIPNQEPVTYPTTTRKSGASPQLSPATTTSTAPAPEPASNESLAPASSPTNSYTTSTSATDHGSPTSSTDPTHDVHSVSGSPKTAQIQLWLVAMLLILLSPVVTG